MEDLSRFKQTYFDESAELLEVAESGLLRLTPGEVDSDEVNAIFRAVHSIKGGGGAFGFTELVAFAHEFETVMDGVRNNTVPVTTELVDTLIRANDLLGQMLAYAREGDPAPAGTTDGTVAALRRHLSGGAPQVQAPAAAAAVPAPAPIYADDEDDEAGLFGDAMAAIAAARAEEDPVPPGKLRWTIVFRPRSDLLMSGNEPAFMLRALRRLGDATVECHTDALPNLQNLEAELLHLSWTVTLLADADVDLDKINDVFEFVADDCDIRITAEAPPPAAPEAPPPVTDPVPVAAPPAVVATVPEPLPKTPGADAPKAETARPRPNGGGAEHAGLTSHTIRVDLDKIDRLVNMVGEMVITQAMIAEHVRELPPGEFQELLEGLEQLAQHTRELRESVMSIRAQPVSSVFSRMPRLVRECAATTGKEVQLVTSGETTEVDKTVVENLVDPLTHMIRNSIDHGLEGPEERERVGKPRAGTVHLSAQHRSGRIVIEITDDGRGINRPKVLSKAIEKGLVQPGATLSDEEIDNLIFLPGFSTADQVSNLSGRGVGMDVVRRNISSLGGRIGVYSTPGEGSRFVLSLPLTLAVLDGMVISVGEERFVLPLTNIVESLRPKAADLHGLVGKCDVMMARGEYVRLVYLHQLFGIPGAVADPTRALVVLVETEDGSRLGLVVDEVLGQQQVVIKSLEANFRRLDGVAAATILGDGRVALILDVAGLREMSRHMDSRAPRPPSSPVAALPAPALEPV
ncbi:chemotaxis protein CheA [Azospirillum brasilense]|uniref:Chemotaxis protein CheA n=3 Tax=Azospirillum TaxID=191 RepID=A0A0P0EKH0_AZOBR|nr:MULTISPECIES: chemotaxis protein CheA [Azospirillum]ALJ36448.1 chemotaxis protein CheA [Azospirillum brasilense]MDW7556389.1 chemotaxis protein CheA [Azospirillum brasilense]MDW7596199.1 chemotaxis protein CheA [Azospirillum brasilense]MDW7631152.1 chemotaxis protein CheA [Azospirillum brasilense]MDX5952977.1 chemotaxis protein CheA [Azospirillum brasilense]